MWCLKDSRVLCKCPCLVATFFAVLKESQSISQADTNTEGQSGQQNLWHFEQKNPEKISQNTEKIPKRPKS